MRYWIGRLLQGYIVLCLYYIIINETNVWSCSCVILACCSGRTVRRGLEGKVNHTVYVDVN